jgi:type IV pilus assembly protein PilV
MVNRNSQKGFSLIEAMIALVVSAIALLGLAAGQIKSLQYSTSSLEYTLSLIQANNAVENTWVSLCGLQDGTVNFAAVNTATQLAKYKIDFPNGFNNDNFVVDVTWNDDRLNDNLDTKVELSIKFPEVCQ